jgi:hypothetical protein
MTMPKTGALPAFLDCLQADGPSADRAGNMDLYGWLIGSWDLDVTCFLPDGSTRRRPGEWHFGWVLEGRAVQDVLICPPRGDGPAREYGSTVRFYDPDIGAWQITWITPPRRAVVRLVGRPLDDQIVLEGDGATGILRWTFSDIASETFTWRGYVSRDAGATWQQREEMRLRRRAG